MKKKNQPEKIIGSAGIIVLDDEAKELLGNMVFYLMLDDTKESPLLQIDDEERSQGLTDSLLYKLSLADNIIRYLITHLWVLDLDIIPLNLLRNVMKEAAKIYDGVLNIAKEDNLAISQRGNKWFEDKTLLVFENMQKDLKLIKKDHLQIIYKFAYGKEKRDFVTRITDLYFQRTGMNLPKSKMDKIFNNIK